MMIIRTLRAMLHTKSIATGATVLAIRDQAGALYDVVGSTWVTNGVSTVTIQRIERECEG